LAELDKEFIAATEPSVESVGTSASATPSEQATTAPPAKKSRSGSWIGYLILLAVLAIAGGGWFLLQELRSRQEGLGGQLSSKDQQLLEMSRQLNALQSELTALHSQFVTVQSQMTTEDSKFERLLSEQSAQFNERLNHFQGELRRDVDHIQRQLNKSRGDLMVADAEYLLSIANQKLHLIGDIKTVLAALEGADQRLYDSGDPAVFKVREALAEEISTLKKFEAPDVVGLSSKLLVLENKVEDLPLFLPHAPVSKEKQDLSQKGLGIVEEGEQSAFDSALRDFKDLITVRRTDRPVQAILTPEQAEALREALQLKLESVRAALLRSDEILYKSSLSSARDWLSEHFDTRSEDVQEILKELDHLATQAIRIPFPDISNSLKLLRNIEKLRLEMESQEMPSKKNKAEKARSITPSEASPATDQGEQP
jgi:uncharacterized protein HemX